jgi:hypothetical protein
MTLLSYISGKIELLTAVLKRYINTHLNMSGKLSKVLQSLLSISAILDKEIETFCLDIKPIETGLMASHLNISVPVSLRRPKINTADVIEQRFDKSTAT